MEHKVQKVLLATSAGQDAPVLSYALRKAMGMTRQDPTVNFHGLYLTGMNEFTEPAWILTVAIVERLKARGFTDATKHLEEILKSVEEAIPRGGDIPETIRLRTGNPDIDESQLDLDSAALAAAAASIESTAERAAANLIERFRQTQLKGVLADADRRLVHMENDRHAFARRLGLTWKKPLELLDLQLALAFELGQSWTQKLRGGRRRKDPELIDVITRLHARSLQVAGEIRTLLGAGFADGALSRWRTVHELTVVAFFIAQEGNETARRYLEHLDVDSYKSALGYDRAASLLGYRNIPAARLKALTKKVEALKLKYGKSFGEEYGWAVLGLKGKPANFASIEEAVTLDRFRPYFRLASGAVHAGPKGAFFRLGTDDLRILLAGPSNTGLQEAIRLVALSVAQITSCLLFLKPTIDSAVWSGVLLDLSTKAEAEAMRVMRRIDREER